MPSSMQCDRPINNNGIQTPPRSNIHVRWLVATTAESYIGFIAPDKAKIRSGFDNVADNRQVREDAESQQTSLQSLGTNDILRKPRVDVTQKTSLVMTPNFSRIPDEHRPWHPSLGSSNSVEGTFLWTVGLFGTIGNGAIVLTAILGRKFARPLHILVTTLAATDLFISVIYIPSYTYYLLERARSSRYAGQDVVLGDRVNKRLIMDSSFCTAGHAIFVEIASVTLTLKSLISLYLFVCSVSKSKSKIYFSKRNTIVFIIFAWILNFLMLFLPSFIGYHKVDFYPSTFQCMFSSQDFTYIHHLQKIEQGRMLFTFLALIIHLLELFAICVSFVKIQQSIARGRSKRRGIQDKKQVEAVSNYSRALTVMSLVFTSVFICWMPIYVINIIDPFHSKLPSVLHHIAMDLFLLKSAISPVIYIYGIRSLRHEMKVLCFCHCNKTKCRGEDTQQTSSFSGPLGSGSTGCEAV